MAGSERAEQECGSQDAAREPEHVGQEQRHHPHHVLPAPAAAVLARGAAVQTTRNGHLRESYGPDMMFCGADRKEKKKG